MTDDDVFEGWVLAAVGGLRRRIEVPARFRGLLDVDDVLQVTFLEAFLRRADCRGETEVEVAAWLGRMADNNLRDALRMLSAAKRPDGGRRVAGSHEESCSRFLEALVETRHTPSRSAAGHEAVEIVRSVVQRLPETYRQVVEAVDLEGLAVADVAGELGRSPGAIHMLRARAHERLRELLGGSGSRFITKGP